MAATPDPAELRRLIVTGNPEDRRAAWRLVQQVPALEREYQRYLIETGQIKAGQRHQYVSFGGYELEQIIHPDKRRFIELGRYEIDYDESFATKITACNFRWINEQATSGHFPVKEVGKRSFQLSLIDFRHCKRTTAKKINCILNELGALHADPAQQLEVALRLPNLQIDIEIVALATHWERRYQIRKVLVLNQYRRGQRLDIGSYFLSELHMCLLRKCMLLIAKPVSSSTVVPPATA